jgi:TfoX/Sxy family transcriptional regulator of competence genes
MARDPGLEEVVLSRIGELPGLGGKAMFGGWGFLLHGHLLGGSRRGSLMLRIGPENEAWALTLPGVVPVVMGSRRMKGYVRLTESALADDAVRERLLNAAVGFTLSLPPK